MLDLGTMILEWGIEMVTCLLIAKALYWKVSQVEWTLESEWVQVTQEGLHYANAYDLPSKAMEYEKTQKSRNTMKTTEENHFFGNAINGVLTNTMWMKTQKMK